MRFLNSLWEKVSSAAMRVIFVVGGVLGMLFVIVLLLTPHPVAQNIASISIIVRLVIVVLIDLLLVWLVYLRIRSDSTLNDNRLIVKTGEAITDVSIESVRERILKAVSALPDVALVDVDVQALHGNADIELRVTVSDDSINVPKKQKEINRALKQVVDKQLGLKMAGRARIHIRFHDGEPLAVAGVGKPATIKPTPVVDTEEPRRGLSFGSLGDLLRRGGKDDADEVEETEVSGEVTEAPAIPTFRDEDDPTLMLRGEAAPEAGNDVALSSKDKWSFDILGTAAGDEDEEIVPLEEGDSPDVAVDSTPEADGSVDEDDNRGDISEA